MKIFDETLARVERSMDVRLVRHNVLAGNVANLDTPGFKPKDVDFSAAMKQASAGGASDLARTTAGHMDGDGGVTDLSSPGETNMQGVRIVEGGGSTPSLDGNEVDLDRTMAAVAENALQYGANARAASKKLAILRYAISEGNG